MRIGPSRALRLYDLLRRRSLIIRAFHFLLFTLTLYPPLFFLFSTPLEQTPLPFRSGFSLLLASARLPSRPRNGARSMHARRSQIPEAPRPPSRAPSRSPPTVSISFILKSCPLKKPIITCRAARGRQCS